MGPRRAMDDLHGDFQALPSAECPARWTCLN